MKLFRVRFKPVGKRYFFRNGHNLDLSDGTPVVVETIRGAELGFVIGSEVEVDDPNLEIKDILRVATHDDLKRFEEYKSQAVGVVEKTKEEVKRLKLEMKVLDAEYTLDHAKLIIYFESESRVDFRELVKNLAEIYHLRIELRQVGSRDGAKVFGGIGPCGLVVCCRTFLTEFDTITVKMAKNQNLALNPVKISGNCGKLLCCIGYEDEVYKDLRKTSPNVGDIVQTDSGAAKVLTCDPLNKTVKVKYVDEPDKFAYLKFEDIKFSKNNFGEFSEKD